MISKIKNYLTLEKIKEIFLYGVGGIGTTILNVVTYQLLLLAIDYKSANLIAIVFTKLAAYIWNKNLVFRSHCKNFKDFVAEFIRFVLARGFTGLIDYFGVIFAVEILSANKVYSKYALTIIVIIINYILGKKAVFIDTNENQDSAIKNTDDKNPDQNTK